MKLIDFGIAVSSIATVKGAPGIVRGKAAYMSPEQCLGDDVDLRTDVFALGVVLYELATGMRCFEGPDDFERMLAVVRGEYVLPSTIDPAFPRDLENVIRTALSIDATKRYPTAAAMIDALEKVARQHDWALGASTVQHAMRTLFGSRVPEPWTAEPDVELAEICANAAERTLRQPMVGFCETDPVDAPALVVEIVDGNSLPSPAVLVAIAPVDANVPQTRPNPPRRRLAAGSAHDLRRTTFDEDALTGRRRPTHRGFAPTPLAA